MGTAIASATQMSVFLATPRNALLPRVKSLAPMMMPWTMSSRPSVAMTAAAPPMRTMGAPISAPKDADDRPPSPAVPPADPIRWWRAAPAGCGRARGLGGERQGQDAGDIGAEADEGDVAEAQDAGIAGEDAEADDGDQVDEEEGIGALQGRRRSETRRAPPATTSGRHRMRAADQRRRRCAGPARITDPPRTGRRSSAPAAPCRCASAPRCRGGG